jgi:hypothetical protein
MQRDWEGHRFMRTIQARKLIMSLVAFVLAPDDVEAARFERGSLSRCMHVTAHRSRRARE